MWVILCVIAASLPWTVVEGAKDCSAAASIGNPETCAYNSTVQGGPGKEIIYIVTLPSSRICCDANSCTDRPTGITSTPSCEFVNIGCHQKGGVANFVSDPLPWTSRKPRIPSMRCYAKSGKATAYAYIAELYVEQI